MGYAHNNFYQAAKFWVHNQTVIFVSLQESRQNLLITNTAIMFVPHSQSSAWHANINFLGTVFFFNLSKGLHWKEGCAQSLFVSVLSYITNS